jgi:hypothetical protein
MQLATLIKASLCSILALGFVSSLQAADATGTWTWTRAARGGGADTKITLKLKVEGDKLTGKISQPGPGGAAATDIDIKDGTVKGADIAFSVATPGRNGGPDMVTKYAGKLATDTITGTMERPGRGGGAPTPTPWEAKREAAAAAVPAAPGKK